MSLTSETSGTMVRNFELIVTALRDGVYYCDAMKYGFYRSSKQYKMYDQRQKEFLALLKLLDPKGEHGAPRLSRIDDKREQA